MPDWYLGANIGLYMLPSNTNGMQIWYIHSDDYVPDAITNVEGNLTEENLWLGVKVSTPLTARHRPELDTTQLLSED